MTVVRNSQSVMVASVWGFVGDNLNGRELLVNLQGVRPSQDSLRVDAHGFGAAVAWIDSRLPLPQNPLLGA